MIQGGERRTVEKAAKTSNGILMLLFALALAGASVWLFINGIRVEDTEGPLQLLGAAGLFTIAGFLLCGLYSLQPNEAAAILLFGDYRGTDKTPGLRWVVPWYTRKKVSLRTRNLTSDTLKVNDKRGNPVEIAANVVWRVADSAQALFDVEDYTAFVNIQVDTGLRDIASHYAYDHGEEHEPTLRADAEVIADRLAEELRSRITVAGIAIDEARLAHLAYAPEIANAMLRRQQAEAVLAARRTIVAGAVTMVESALQQLGERGVVELDNERRASVVSNLLVVRCAERGAQPVVNTGTLYQ